MAFPTVTDRNVQYPTRVELTEVSTGIYDVDAVPGNVVAEGTAVNAALFSAINAHIEARLLAMHPVGCVYTSVSSTSPATLFGGTWSAFGAGRVLVGIDATDAAFDTVEEMGGNKLLQAHTHTNTVYIDITPAGGTPDRIIAWGNTAGHATYDIATNSTGGGNAENLQPYITVYMWKRTA
jgi:hypothetical protein